MKIQTASTSTAALRDLWARSGGALESLAELDQDLVAQARSKATTLCSIDGKALEASAAPTRACITDSEEFGGSGRPSFHGWCIDGNGLEASYNPTRALPCITDSIDFETSAGTSFGCGF